MDQYQVSRLFDLLDALLGGIAKANDFQLVKITGSQQVHFVHKATRLEVVLDFPKKTLRLP